MKVFVSISLCLSLVLTLQLAIADSLDNPKELTEEESIILQDAAMGILSSINCRKKFRKYLNEKGIAKAFAYTVDPRGFYDECQTSYMATLAKAENFALKSCNIKRDENEYIRKFSPACKLFASNNNLEVSMADFGLKPLEIDIFSAVQRKSLATIKKMVAAGADTHQPNKFGSTPLSKAVRDERLDVVEYLIDTGSSLKSSKNMDDDVLIIAAQGGNVKLLELLLNKGADIDAKSEKAGKGVIHYAAERDHRSLLKLLLSKDVDINQPDNFMITPLHYAVDGHHFKTVEMLVENGADVNAKTQAGRTPLDYAIRQKLIGIAGYLDSKGAIANNYKKIANPLKPSATTTSDQQATTINSPALAQDTCTPFYETLKKDAPGDISKCDVPVKDAHFEKCKEPQNYSAERPASHVVLVLDASGSMGAKLGGRSKMSIAKSEAERFLTSLEKDVPIGLVVYGHKGDNTKAGKKESCSSIEWKHKVGSIRGKVKSSLDKLTPVGWTPLSATLNFLEKELANLRIKKDEKFSIPVVYVLSDGKETCGGDPVAAAKALHESGVKATVNVIGFDVDAKTRDQLKAISEAGGGKYFPAKDSSALRKQLDAAHRQEAELARYKYCMALNVGYAGVVYHNAKINLSGCYLRESKRNRLEYITQQIKAFDTDEKKACAPKIKQLLSADDVKERNWFIETNTRLNNDNKAATDAVHEKSVFHNILTK